MIALLAARQRVRDAKESTGINVTLAVVDFLTQLLLVMIGAVLILSPEQLVDNVSLGTAPTWDNFILAIPIGMLAYTGIETVSNMAEEAKDEATTIPAAIKRVQHRRVRDLLHAAGGRALRAARDAAADGEYVRRSSA